MQSSDCQLRVDDIKRDSGLDELGNPIDVVYFNVAEDNDEEGKKKKKSVKTPYSVRKVPIPDYLLNLGFLQYVEDVAKAGFSEVFPRVENKEEDPGHPMTMWFRKYRKACGIKSRKKTFHCFRHTFTSLAKYSLIPENVIDAINGHAPENTCKDRRYATRPNVFACKKYIEKIAFPPTPMQPYTPGRFDAYFETVKESRQHQAANQESLERRQKEEVKKAKASKKAAPG